MENNYVFPQSTPEQQGVSSRAVLAFLQEVKEQGLELHGLIILRHDHIISAGWWLPYKPTHQFAAYSLTKSLMSTAIGFAVGEGRFSVDDQVITFFPEMGINDMKVNVDKLTIRHLLTMSTGHTEDTTRFNEVSAFLMDTLQFWIGDQPDGDWVKGFFDQPLNQEPGSHFLYNSGASHLLAVILQRVTGKNVLDYLMPRLFEPLGIERPAWETALQGGSTGGWGAKLKTVDWAKFGQLLLRKGMWNGKRILSEAWIDEATSKQVETFAITDRIDNGIGSDWEQGYGYQFWRSLHGAYRGAGAFGQLCVVLPDKDAVIAMNSNVSDAQKVMDLIWKHLQPSMGANALQEDIDSYSELRHRLQSLDIYQREEFRGPVVTAVQCYQMEPNEDKIIEFKFDFEVMVCRLTWVDALGNYEIVCGLGSWGEENQIGHETVAARGTWQDDQTFVIDICRIHATFHDELICAFEGGGVTLNYKHLGLTASNRQLRGHLI